MPVETSAVKAIFVKRVLLCALSLAILLFVIWWGGPFLTQKYMESYKASIDRNGVLQKAVITGKDGHKGHAVVFSYTYKGRSFSNREQDKGYFDDLVIGVTVQVMIDTTDPKESYIFATGTGD